MRETVNEGLRSKDLEGMVYSLFEVDTFKSKMGEDKDVCVISFHVRERAPAKDLMEFIEKGYSFVLDADVSSGENEKGEYSVFVEISRTPKLVENIKELCYGVRKLTGIDDFQFKYHRKEGVHQVSEETLASIIPPDAPAYEGMLNLMRTESVKKFFNKTLMDDFTLENDIITIHKPFDQKIKLKMVKEASSESILEGIADPIAVDETAMSEIFWLTKVLGNYNINKIGDSFLFDNNGQSLLLQRIE